MIWVLGYGFGAWGMEGIGSLGGFTRRLRFFHLLSSGSKFGIGFLRMDFSGLMMSTRPQFQAVISELACHLPLRT